MQIQGGVYKALLKDFKEAAESGVTGTANAVSAKETRAVLAKGVAAIKEQFDGETSEKGLAAARNALAKTFRAADKNWSFSDAAYRVAAGFLGPELDGKGGSMAKVEAKLRSAIRGPSSYGY